MAIIITAISLLVIAIILIIPYKEPLATIQKIKKCPEHSSDIFGQYEIVDNCYCIEDTTLQSGRCKMCPENSTTRKVSKIKTDTIGCNCLPNHRWSDNKCVKNPDNSTIINTGIKTDIDGIYCLNGHTYKNGSCIKCPDGSSTVVTENPIGECYCYPGKVNIDDKCVTILCDGNGKIIDNKCKCDDGYYLLNDTLCTKCENGTIDGSICYIDYQKL